MSTTPQKSVAQQIIASIKVFLTIAGAMAAGAVGLVGILILLAMAWSLFIPSSEEEVERLRQANPTGFIGIPKDQDAGMQLIIYGLFSDRVREGRHEPERLKQGQSISDVKWHLGVYPLYRRKIERDGVELATYVWEIEAGKLIETIFIDDELQTWEWIESDEEPAQPLAEVQEDIYPMSAAAQIRGTVLDFRVYDNFNYYDAQFVISSGEKVYGYELQVLPGAKVTSIELTEFSDEGWRFSPYSHVVDGLIVAALRPDGAEARFITTFTGDMRK